MVDFKTLTPNILRAAFLYKSFLRSFYALTIWVCNFLGKRILAQKLLIKCWWNGHQLTAWPADEITKRNRFCNRSWLFESPLFDTYTTFSSSDPKSGFCWSFIFCVNGVGVGDGGGEIFTLQRRKLFSLRGPAIRQMREDQGDQIGRFFANWATLGGSLWFFEKMK